MSEISFLLSTCNLQQLAAVSIFRGYMADDFQTDSEEFIEMFINAFLEWAKLMLRKSWWWSISSYFFETHFMQENEIIDRQRMVAINVRRRVHNFDKLIDLEVCWHEITIDSFKNYVWVKFLNVYFCKVQSERIDVEFNVNYIFSSHSNSRTIRQSNKKWI